MAEGAQAVAWGAACGVAASGALACALYHCRRRRRREDEDGSTHVLPTYLRGSGSAPAPAPAPRSAAAAAVTIAIRAPDSPPDSPATTGRVYSMREHERGGGGGGSPLAAAPPPTALSLMVAERARHRADTPPVDDPGAVEAGATTPPAH